jgi:hypothetical protein
MLNQQILVEVFILSGLYDFYDFYDFYGKFYSGGFDHWQGFTGCGKTQY